LLRGREAGPGAAAEFGDQEVAEEIAAPEDGVAGPGEAAVLAGPASPSTRVPPKSGVVWGPGTARGLGLAVEEAAWTLADMRILRVGGTFCPTAWS